MSGKPLVSVVIPTRNRASFLRECLGSVFRQTLRDFEVIVVDDASSDDTAAVIRAAGSRQIKPVFLKAPSGAPRARAAGLRRASGQFVAFLDDDDQWRPRKLALQIERLASAGAAASHSDFDVVGAEGKVLHASCLADRSRGPAERRRPALRKLLELYRGGHVPGWPAALFSSVVLRRSAIRSVGGFDLRFGRLHDDTDLWLRVCRKYGPSRTEFIDQVLVDYRFHPGQISVTRLLAGGDRREKTPALFDALVDNTLFLDKVDAHAYCAERDHVCRRFRRGRFTCVPSGRVFGFPRCRARVFPHGDGPGAHKIREYGGEG